MLSYGTVTIVIEMIILPLLYILSKFEASLHARMRTILGFLFEFIWLKRSQDCLVFSPHRKIEYTLFSL